MLIWKLRKTRFLNCWQPILMLHPSVFYFSGSGMEFRLLLFLMASTCLLTFKRPNYGPPSVTDYRLFWGNVVLLFSSPRLNVFVCYTAVLYRLFGWVCCCVSGEYMLSKVLFYWFWRFSWSVRECAHDWIILSFHRCAHLLFFLFWGSPGWRIVSLVGVTVSGPWFSVKVANVDTFKDVPNQACLIR